MSVNIEEVNAELTSLIDSYAAGMLAAGEYRQRRRVLVCKVSGEEVPEVEDEGSAERTLLGGMAAVNINDLSAEGKAEAAPGASGPKKSNALYWFVTAITLLVAIACVGGLFWYVFR